MASWDCALSNGEGMCVARRAVGVAWLTWLLRVGEPGRVVAIGIWSHTVWDLHSVWSSTLPGALDLSCGVEGALVAWWVMSGQGLGHVACQWSDRRGCFLAVAGVFHSVWRECWEH